MRKFFLDKNKIAFLGLFFVYIVIVFSFSESDLIGDESRHLQYAQNLTEGFYTNSDNPEFRNGPGYPLVIAPLKFLNTPYLVYKLFNACLLILGVLLFYRSISTFLNSNLSLLFSIIFGLYPPFLKWMVHIYSESLTVFLACGFLFYLIRPNNVSKKKIPNWVIPGFLLGMLVLTKVLFGYVLIVLLILYALLYLIRKSNKARNAIYVLGVALITCVPYLAYTYSLTGKAFLWGTGGGEILYWRSTPHEGEYGDWVSSAKVFGKAKHRYTQTKTLNENHGKFIENLEGHSYLEKDNMFKKKAIENIKTYPLKYLENSVASACRLLFNFPNSYTTQRMSTNFYIVPNMFLIVFLAIAVYLGLTNAKAINAEVWFVTFIASVYMGGLVLLNGIVRHLIPVVPFLLYFILVIFHKTLIIKKIAE